MYRLMYYTLEENGNVKDYKLKSLLAVVSLMWASTLHHSINNTSIMSFFLYKYLPNTFLNTFISAFTMGGHTRSSI